MRMAPLRAIFSTCVFFVALVFALPNIPQVEKSIGNLLPDSQINLGLDLKGGVSLTLGVQVDAALKNFLSSTGQDVKDLASEENVMILQSRIVENTLELIVPKASDEEPLRNLLSTTFPQLDLVDVEIGANSERIFKLNFVEAERVLLEEQVLDQAVTTIRNRIDQFGVAEPDIRKQADNRIQIQLPGLDNPDRAIALVGQTASLAFHLVRDDVDTSAFRLPAGTAFFPMKTILANGQEHESQIVLDSAVLMTGVDITDARPSYGDMGEIYVGLDFNNQGAKDFEEITGDNVGKRIAIVLDGTVFSAPVVNERIVGGSASISGSANIQEAQDLAIILRAGALPAPVEVLEERTVGPSLGADSIRSGLLAALVGGLAVMVIMPIYYGKSGLIADIMLCFSMLLLFAGLGAFGATLTLPGIAGIVLTIGMAVDANVLIYERIREELKHGHSPLKAVEAGFARASISILDSQVTTMIVALILYQFGTGPVRGFAVTLAIGILASLFTAVFVSRDVFVYWMKKSDSISI